MKYLVNHILYTFIQLTYGMVQNLMGILLWLFLHFFYKSKSYYYHGAIVTSWPFLSSMGLGMFIFFGHSREELDYQQKILVHEYGHTIQSCILGPLFLLVVGIPSTLWCLMPKYKKLRKEGKYSYFDLYCEKWANYEGERILHMPSPHQRKADQ